MKPAISVSAYFLFFTTPNSFVQTVTVMPLRQKLLVHT